MESALRKLDLRVSSPLSNMSVTLLARDLPNIDVLDVSIWIGG